MYEQVTAMAGAAGVALAPVVVRAAAVAPTLRRSSDRDRSISVADATDLLGGDDSATPELSHRSVVAPPRTSSSARPNAARRLLVAGLAAGAVLAVFGARLGVDAALPAYVLFGVVAVVLAIVDLEHHRLPDVLTLPSCVVGAALLGAARLAGSDSGSLRRALLGAVVAFALFAALYLAMPSGIGAGDVKFAGVIGLYAAWLGWGSLVVALFGGFVVGAVVSLVLLVAGRAGRHTRVPFGPSMVAGAVLAIGWGEEIAGAWRGG